MIFILNIDVSRLNKFCDNSDFVNYYKGAVQHFDELLQTDEDNEYTGWLDIDECFAEHEMIKQLANKIRADAEVFVLVGVGGSNQAARAMIKALQKINDSIKIIYLGNTLSSQYINKQLAAIKGKSVYINVIAKNFETLEPGSHFRILRNFLASKYSDDELSKRIIITGTKGSQLHELAKAQSFTFLTFPQKVGGRYSAFTSVCLLPIAVAGFDTDKFLYGIKDQFKQMQVLKQDNSAVIYACARNILYNNGFDIESIVSFEPSFSYFFKWWIQLFGESEGKNNKGIFPCCAIYSEDLHSLGQYMQSGRRCIIETFLSVKNLGLAVPINKDCALNDGFDYLDGMDFTEINKIAEESTINAHSDGGLPCIQILIDKIDEEHFGRLFAFFMLACAVSGKVLGINPFDQEGVEEYKKRMFKALKK